MMVFEAEVKKGNLFEMGFKSAVLEHFRVEEVYYPFIDRTGRTLSAKEEIERYLERVKTELSKEENDVLEKWRIYKTGRITAEAILKKEGITSDAKLTINRILEREEFVGSYRNADVLLYDESREFLSVFELTLGGGGKVHDTLISGMLGEVSSLFSFGYGVGIEVSYQKTDFLSIVEEILNAVENSRYWEIFWTAEILKTLQAYSYALSFLKEREEKVRELLIRVVYPHREGVRQRLRLPENYKEVIDSKNLWERTDGLYRELKKYSKSNSYGVDFYREKIKEIGEKVFVIPKERDVNKVRKRVEEVVLGETPNKVVLLLHPAGSGKTNAIIKLFESLDTPVFLLHLSPRRIIVEDKAKELEKRGYAVVEDYRLPAESVVFSGVQIPVKTKGRLHQVKERFPKYLEDYEKVAVFTTTQAVVNFKKGKKSKKDTTVHVKEMLESFFRQYPDGYAIIAVDELLGDEGSLPALRKIAKVVKELEISDLDKNLNEKKVVRAAERTYLFGMDANLINGDVAEKVFEYLLSVDKSEIIDYLPAFLTKTKGEYSYRERTEHVKGEEYFGLPTVSYTIPTYPTKEKLKVRAEVIPFSKRTLARERENSPLIKVIKDLGKKTFVYVQNKDLAKSINDVLHSAYEVKTKVITSTLQKGYNEIATADYVIATSSVSRGVDVPFSKMVAVLPAFDVESQSAEVLQGTSRIRKKVEDEDKEVVLTVTYPESFEEVKQTYKELFWESKDLEELEKELAHLNLFEKVQAYHLAVGYKLLKLVLNLIEASILPDPNKEYLIPIPKIKERSNKGMNVSSIIMLYEILKDRRRTDLLERFDFELKKANPWQENENFLGFKEIDSEVPPEMIIYPFAIYRAKVSAKLDRELVEKSLELIRNCKYLPDVKKKEIESFLNKVLREKISETPDETFYLAEYLPSYAYRDRIKDGYYLLTSPSIGKNEFSSLKGEVFVRNGIIYFPILETELLPNRLELPKLPLEMLPL